MNQRLSLRARLGLTALAGVVHAVAALGQTNIAKPTGIAVNGVAERPALERPITIRLSQAPLRDVLRFLELSANVRFAPMWADAEHVDGMNPDSPVDLDVNTVTLLSVIETLVSQTDPTVGGGCTWQISDDGRIQIGPRSRLNAHKHVVIYDIRDLLFQPKDSREAATIDLQAALQASQGSGGSTPVLREPTQEEAAAKPDATTDVVELLTQFIEPGQWETNGGSGASLRVYQKTLVVRAPGYIHRQIKGDRYLASR